MVKKLSIGEVIEIVRTAREKGQRPDLRRANLRGLDLTGADLTGAALIGAALRGANLYMADLNGADLYMADLIGAALNGANLIGAALNGADLTGANLKWANLNGANLNGANLIGADLKWADLTGATLEWHSHALIAEILRHAAGDDISRQMVAAFIGMRTDLCWDDFLALDELKPYHDWALDELKKWVKEGDKAPEVLREFIAATDVSIEDKESEN